jgi:predicted RNase H-like HicB family nuclease
MISKLDAPVARWNFGVWRAGLETRAKQKMKMSQAIARWVDEVKMARFHAIISLEADMKLTAVFEKVGEWWLGYVEELPGANTQGETLDEARENLREAVQLIIEANRELLLEQMAGHEIIREPLLI